MHLEVRALCLCSEDSEGSGGMKVLAGWGAWDGTEGGSAFEGCGVSMQTYSCCLGGMSVLVSLVSADDG